MTKKRLRWTFAALVMVCAAVGLFLYSIMGRPLYEPGMVREGVNLRHPLTPPEQPEGGSYWQVEPDIRLYYEAHGQGPAVLVVHGGPGFPYARPWAGLETLTADHTVYYYHQRGCGESTIPFDRFESKNYYANMTELERTLGIGAQIADIERIRQILGERKLTIVGHSFGGFLASLYAAEFPDHVARLVLVAPAGVLVLPAEQGDLYEQLGERLPVEERGEYDRFRNDELFDFGNLFSKSEAELAEVNRRGGAYLLKALGESSAAAADESQPVNGGWMPYALYFSMGSRHDYRAPLSSVDAPVLILHGADDDLLLPGSRSYVDCLPNAEFQIVSGDEANPHAGHFVFDDQPEEFAAQVGDFLKSIQ